MMTPTEALIAYLEARGLRHHKQTFREVLHTLVQALMESDVGQLLDARLYERNGARRAYRNGYRDSVWYSSLGPIPLRIPRLRKGSYYPHFLDGQAESVLLQLVQAAFVSGVDFDAVDAAIAALDLAPLPPYDIADMAERLADVLYNAQHDPLHNDYPVLFCDVLDVEQDGRWRQLMIVVGIEPDGSVALLAHDLVSVADDRTWIRLLEQLRRRGLDNVDVVVSDNEFSVRTAVSATLVDAVWQHHRHFLLQGSDDDGLVRAVSDLAVRVETGQRHLPRMAWPIDMTKLEFSWADFPLMVIG